MRSSVIGSLLVIASTLSAPTTAADLPPLQDGNHGADLRRYLVAGLVGVVGIGGEWAWSGRVSLRSEVLFVDIPDRKMRVPLSPGSSVPYDDITQSDSMWIGRIGINVKLGGPVVAND
jgi:hypothetical protein